MKNLHFFVHYFLILWFANDMRETLVSLDSVFSVRGIACILALVATAIYFLILLHDLDEH